MDRLAPLVFEMKTSRHVAYLFFKRHLVAAKQNRYGQHAEMAVLPHVDMKKRYRLYVTRQSGHGRLSRPCLACSNILRRYHNIRVFYSDENGDWAEDSSLDNRYLAPWRARRCHMPR